MTVLAPCDQTLVDAYFARGGRITVCPPFARSIDIERQPARTSPAVSKRRVLVAEAVRANPDLSYRQIARKIGVAEATFMQDCRMLIMQSRIPPRMENG